MNDIVEQCLFPWQSNIERKHELSVGGHSVRPNQWGSSVFLKLQVSKTEY